MDPLVSSGVVCYAGNLFGSVPWANRYILKSSENFVELLVELFWSVQVVFKKTLTKSHDYSRLFSKEKRRLKMKRGTFGDKKIAKKSPKAELTAQKTLVKGGTRFHVILLGKPQKVLKTLKAEEATLVWQLVEASL